MSDIIKLLPESVANQIAAGEVIQRPASVVKELLENSVDAGADAIDLIIKDAGKTLIQVVDNGCGMSAMDARMSFERHATSKIQKADDLFAIRTMGFRGEALASVAAIAQVEMKTRLVQEELGTCLRIEGSEVISQDPCPCKPGTSIAVKNLFYNVPARRNFLKSNTVETRHVIEEFTRVALVNPDIAFNFTHNGKPVFRLPKSSFKARIVNIFGKNYDQKLIPVEQKTSLLAIKGFIGKPEFAKKTRGEQYFFVNGRFIKHPYLHHAVENAFAELLASDAFPSYFINIEIDPSEIDINIHPTKTEVNFRDGRYMYAVMQSAVKQSVGKHTLTPTLDFETDPSIDALLQANPTEIKQPEIKINPEYNPFKSAGDTKPFSRTKGDVNWQKLYEDLPQEQSEQSVQNQEPLPETEEEKIVDHNKFFQIHNRFIVTNVRSGLMLIDQQKAHERILYEKYLKEQENNTPASQQQLFPVTVQFSPADAEIIRSLKAALHNLGFTFEPIGSNGFVFQGLPEGVKASETEEVLEKLLEVHKKESSDLNKDKNIILARSLASRLSLKQGKKLNTEEMSSLFDALFACKLPEVALDGSKTVAIIPLTDLEKYLKEKNR